MIEGHWNWVGIIIEENYFEAKIQLLALEKQFNKKK